MKARLALLAAVLTASCGGALRGGTLNLFEKPQVITPLHAVTVTVRDVDGPVRGAYCWIDGVTDSAKGPSDYTGAILFTAVPLALRAVALKCKADGYQPFAETKPLTGAIPEPPLVAVLVKL